MPVEDNQFLRNELNAIVESRDITQPYIMHRTFNRERQCLLQHFHIKCHTTAKVTILQKQIIEYTLACIVICIEGRILV